jgi:hypothetical protein
MNTEVTRICSWDLWRAFNLIICLEIQYDSQFFARFENPSLEENAKRTYALRFPAEENLYKGTR